jgi:hypothetical protein
MSDQASPDSPGSTQAAGWYNDPYGRFQLRYWGGTAWTEHVSTAGTQQVDPLGTSTIVPFAIPKTATEAHAATGAPTVSEAQVASGAQVATGAQVASGAHAARPGWRHRVRGWFRRTA